MEYVFAPKAPPSLAVDGISARFPVHRIYCIGRNYADHAKEMGMPVDRTNPVFFCKPADAVLDSGAKIPYPPATKELHHEVEMVVALQSGGANIAPADALRHVYGYGVGLDLTRRDLQAAAKAKGNPWDASKAFDRSAPVSALRPARKVGNPLRGKLVLEVNGSVRQQADISEMIFGVPQIISELSKLFELTSGDLIFTGTPAGVGPLQRGDWFKATLEGLGELHGAIA
ncbi:MAG TPA: fumarylacetoacetate hydrolase family protein [Rudaea sp.]|nr:fumarylacetoacetate hydrolase family protein [Rudaea sp.]